MVRVLTDQWSGSDWLGPKKFKSKLTRVISSKVRIDQQLDLVPNIQLNFSHLAWAMSELSSDVSVTQLKMP